MLTVVAVALDLKGNPKTIRLAEVEDKRFACGKIVEKHKMRTRDFDVSVVISELAKGTKVGGLRLVDGKLAGSNGALTRYMNINRTGVKSPLVVLARNIVDGNNVGFCVADGNGNVINLKEEDAVEYAEKHGIANGKIVENAGKKFISSIEGEYPDVKINMELQRPKPITPVVQQHVVEKPQQQVMQPSTVVEPKKAVELDMKDLSKAKIDAPPVEPLVPLKKAESKKDDAPVPSYDDLKAQEEFEKKQPRYVDPSGLKWYEGDSLRDAKTGLSVKEKIALCMMNIKKMNLFVHSILASMERVPCNHGEIDTMAVSPFTMTLYYNCQFVNELSVGQCLFVMIHEAYHILMKHGIRQYTRDHELWNMAGDYYINKMIAEQFNLVDNYPGTALIDANCSFVNTPEFDGLPNNLSKYIEGLPFALYNEKTNTAEDSVESIYDILASLKEQVENEKKQESGQSGEDKDGNQSSGGQGGSDNKDKDDKQKQQNGGAGQQQNEEGSGDEADGNDDANGGNGGDGDQDGEQSGSQSGGKQGDKQGQGQKQQSGNGSGNSSSNQGDSSNDSEGGNGENSNSNESGQSGTGQGQNGKKQGTGRSYSGRSASKDGYTYHDKPNIQDIINDLAKDGKISEEDAKRAQENLKRAVSNAAAKVRQAGRELDLASKRFVDSILEPKIDFRAILKRKLNMQTDYNSTWKRPSKRGELTAGINAPGRIKSVEDGLTRAIVAIDSSGSMTEDDLKYAFGYIKVLCKQLKVDLDVCFWNTVVESVYGVADIKDITKIKEVGTGGTDVSCLFSYVAGETEVIRSFKKDKGKKRKTKTDVLIVITDGYFDANYARYKKAAKDVIWILSDRRAYEDFAPMFGSKAPIQVDR